MPGAAHTVASNSVAPRDRLQPSGGHYDRLNSSDGEDAGRRRRFPNSAAPSFALVKSASRFPFQCRRHQVRLVEAEVKAPVRLQLSSAGYQG